MDERHWIHAIQKGDKKYLQDIAEKYYDDIYRFCAFQTGNREDAYDLAQETFLRFIRYVEGYRERNLKGYLLTIAMNVCRDFLREKGREAGFILYENQQLLGERGETEGSLQETKAAGQSWYWTGGQPSEKMSFPEQKAIEADIHGRLMEALSELPQMQREAVLLHYLCEMKYREIGRLTGVSVSTVKSRVRQGMDKLQCILKKEDFLD